MASNQLGRRRFALSCLLALVVVGVSALVLVLWRGGADPSVPMYMSPRKLQSLAPDQVASIREVGWLGTMDGDYSQTLTQEYVAEFLDVMGQLVIGPQQEPDMWVGASSSFHVTLNDGRFFAVSLTPSQLLINGNAFVLPNAKGQWEVWRNAHSHMTFTDVYREWEDKGTADADSLSLPGFLRLLSAPESS